MVVRIVLTGLLLLTLLSTLSVAQEKERLIQRVFANSEPPVQITEIRFAGRSIDIGKPFMANDNWLYDLEIAVKNISDKSIRYFEVSLVFEPVGFENTRVPFAAYFGKIPYKEDCSPVPTGLPIAEESRQVAPAELPILKPNETALIHLEPNRLKKFLEYSHQHGYGEVDRVRPRPEYSEVYFDENRGWARGMYRRRDPDNQCRWTFTKDPL